jgi:YVTN family beta-propeller protein
MAAGTAAGETEPAQFRILGPLEVVRFGCAVPLGGPRQRAVLALLLLEANRVVSIDRLVEDLWGGRPPEGSVTTLQTYVFHLRRALEPDRLPGAAADLLVTRDRGYQLRVSQEYLDAAAFEHGLTAGRTALAAGRYGEAAERLRNALDLWRGPVLADLADYAFIRPEAARLEELRLAGIEDRIDADLALGRHHALTAELERLVAEHPLRERLHGQLMLALYRCGRQADALAAYRRVRDLLAGELGIDPGEPLQRLHGSILAHDSALNWSGGRQAPAEGHPADAGAPATSPAPGRPALRPAGGRRELDWVRRRARSLLVIGAVLAVAAAVGIVVVARPWAGGPVGLPPNSVGLIDSTGGRVGEPVIVGSPEGLAYGDGSVWAVDSGDDRVSRIDPAAHAVVQTIPVGSAPSAVTVTGGDVWVANSGDGTVSRISAATNEVVDTIAVGNVPVAIASERSGVWVANQGDDTVRRINSATGLPSSPVSVGARPDGIAVGPDAVWVANGGDGTVSRIDPATGTVSSPIAVGAGPAGIAVTSSAVWVANSLDLSVTKINPRTARVTDTIPVGDGPHAIVAGSDGVWVSDEFDATLDHIDPRAGRVVRALPVGSSPQGLALTPSGVWVGARPFAAATHRGGTLTVVTQWLPQLDPAQAYGIADLPALATVYDGLVALRRSGGAHGLTLVPDLATALPHPTDGGKTYTFSIRRGIRYSTGALVRASDFRRGLERLLPIGGSPTAYYKGIVGAQACGPHRPPCHLAAGIVTDDAAGTVTFHLSAADPDFLDKLALLLAVPAPPGAPHGVIDRAPFLPGTGPYKIAQYQPNGPYRVAQYRPNASLTLVRNPYFRQWSYAAQPAGYPDVIRLKRIANPKKLESAVMTGTADMVDLILNGLPSHDLAVRYPTRLHSGPKVGTTYVFLNTRQPPFNNLRARQAVSYAIDRARMVQLLGDGPGEESVTCQVLPADFPGHRPYCPYTTGVKDGTWHGPDMAKALRLVKASHTTNVPVTVWNYPGAEGAYLVSLLRDLGYRATLHTVSAEKFYSTIPNARRKIQIGPTSWGADFPAPSTFFLSLTCRSFYENPAYTANYAEYCSPRVDKLAAEAQAEQLTDPATARMLWAHVDRAVTDQAPWVPVFNGSWTVFVSSRVGNCQIHANYGPLLDQMWVR